VRKSNDGNKYPTIVERKNDRVNRCLTIVEKKITPSPGPQQLSGGQTTTGTASLQLLRGKSPCCRTFDSCRVERPRIKKAPGGHRDKNSTVNSFPTTVVEESNAGTSPSTFVEGLITM